MPIKFSFTDSAGSVHPECYTEIISVSFRNDAGINPAIVQAKTRTFHSLASMQEGYTTLDVNNSFSIELTKNELDESSSLFKAVELKLLALEPFSLGDPEVI